MRQFDLWSCNPAAIAKYLNHYDDLESHRIAIGIHDNHPILGHAQLDLLDAASDLEQVEALGYSEEAASTEMIMAWRSRTEKLAQLMERVDGALGKSGVSFQYEDLTVGQLAVLPDVLRDVKGLAFHILEQVDDTLWSSSVAEVRSLQAGMKVIQGLESDLRSQSLVIPVGTSSYVLQSAAKKIETTPWLLQAFDGEYSKAIERARRLGAKGSNTQQAKSLRRIAQLLQLRETFSSERCAELCATTSSFKESAKIIEQIEEFKSSLQRRGMLELLDFFKNTTSAEVERLVRIFEASVSADLSGLLEQSWLGIDIGKTAFKDLHSVIQRNRDELALVERLYPYIAWHGQAEGAQQSTPEAWLRAVAKYITRLDSFPSSELLALTGNQCTLEEALASMQALKPIQDGLGSWRLEDKNTILIRSIPIADVEPLLVLLRDQLLPSLRVFLDLVSNQGVNIGTAQVDDLLESAKQTRQSFLDLIQRHAELGIINDLLVEDLVSAPIDLLLHQKREQELQFALVFFKQCGGEVLGVVSAHDLQQVMAWLERLHNSDLPDSLVSQCLKSDSGAWIVQQSEVCKELSRTLQQEAEASSAFIGKTTAVASQLPGSPSTFDNASADHLCQWLGEVCSLAEFVSSWLRFQELLSSLPSEAERQLAQCLLDSAVDGALWPDLYRWNVVRSRLISLTAAQPQLSSLRAADQVARRKRFAKTEDELRRLDRAEVIAAIHNDPDECQQGISEGLKGDFTEMALIRNESVRRIKHRPLHHLFQYAGNALRGLKPCWMMSPTTVASLLPRSKGEDFDLVVIDEASQMSPERALGVISSAKQCVVVGDPQQLPPTSLFQRNTAWEDSDDADEIDIDVLEEESILDLSSKAFQPTRRLKWHYRSRNGSLIAFSNKHFYDSQLVVFPACRREFAITRHLVEEPRYKKGVNEPEFRDVCDIVIRQLELYPERTLGVVAMNEPQADAIAEQLDDLAFHHDELRRRLDLRDNSESLFVKPLEKVQGDERDTIVISTTYGLSEPGGTIPLRFGLLNRASGHRRLNVLFTRAKHAIELVTSLKSNQLRLPATAGPGLLAFRDYLRYVEKGSVDSESAPVREPNTPFEKLVFGLLSQQGFTAACGVGFSNYFIDLAVRHPDATDHYLLALEGDGANYNSARAARDRDKYRQTVLESLGWNVYKVWSTDWFDNPEGEIKKLVSQLKRLRKSVVIPCDHTEELRVKSTISARPRDGNSPRDAAESSELPDPDPEPEPVSTVSGTPP
jgi:very-short-patch-repair endonuclease